MKSIKYVLARLNAYGRTDWGRLRSRQSDVSLASAALKALEEDLRHEVLGLPHEEMRLLAEVACRWLQALQRAAEADVDIMIDPKNMLTVTVADADGCPSDVVVVTCGYVVATNPTGERAIAIELVTDPDTPNPTEPYACPPRRLKRELLAPQRLLKVRSNNKPKGANP